ncbi:divergent protein kinase domain 1C [Plutella xylostella]|uniref:divergent protein kinase domain 1C n=1 Tax=Plutella xylostella TaxID=51655 RepID=UPI002032EF73|nr:divergent protein kinase domain 1C [Plutella xylostella]
MRQAKLFFIWTYALLGMMARRRCLLLTFLIGASLLGLMMKWGLLCSSWQPQLHIQKVCQDVASGVSIGNLCPALCQHGLVSSISCHNFYMGKEAVFSAIWDSSSVVFKSPRKTLIETDDLTQWLNNNSKEVPSEDEFSQMIRTNIKIKFNMTIDDLDAKKLSYFKFKNSIYWRRTEMANIWSLLQDNEYLAMTLYEKYDVFPKLVGSCGSMFAVQHLKSISGFWHLITLYDSKEEWRNRIKIALKIMELLNTLEKLPPDALHICDVKMSHFGITDDMKRAKYLDLDSVHPKSVVNKITGDGSACKQHSDCDFFDCRSFCNLVSSRCEFGVVNNNMQVVCEKIFLGWVSPGRLVVPGLLLGSHTPLALVSLLESCANPAAEPGAPRAAAPPQLAKRLYSILLQLSLPD